MAKRPPFRAPAESSKGRQNMNNREIIKKAGRIGVLLGGPSSERDISVKSGDAVYEALISAGCDALKIDIKDPSYFSNEISAYGIDIAFIALHGSFGEDGQVQNLLEDMGIPYIGSGPAASRIALDKTASKAVFKIRNIPTPGHTVIAKKEKAEFLKQDGILPLPFPFIIKPSRQGSSIGMSIVKSRDMLEPALDEAFKHGDEVIAEEYITGEDITVGILNNRPLPVINIRPKESFYNFNAKYTDGMSEYIVPAVLPEEVTKRAQQLGLLAHHALGCESFSRVDMLINRDNNITVLEVNTIPGLTSSSLLPKAAKAAGIDFTQMCIEMVKTALSRKREVKKRRKGVS